MYIPSEIDTKRLKQLKSFFYYLHIDFKNTNVMNIILMESEKTLIIIIILAIRYSMIFSAAAAADSSSFSHPSPSFVTLNKI